MRKYLVFILLIISVAGFGQAGRAPGHIKVLGIDSTSPYSAGKIWDLGPIRVQAPLSNIDDSTIGFSGTQGDLLYFSASTTLSRLAKAASHLYLSSDGTNNNPAYEAVNLADGVSGILPVANGGTGTATPGIVAGTNITVTGTWPNQTVNSTASGGGSSTIVDSTITSSATPTPNASTTDQFNITALAANATFGAPANSPSNSKILKIRIKDNGTARTLAWNAIYHGGPDFAIPTTTAVGITMNLQFVYNPNLSQWECLGYTNIQ